MSKVMIMDHPLIQHKIGIIRRQETGSKDFRQLISEIAMLMCYEATRDLELTQHVHIQQMAESAMSMLTESIDAFVRKDLLLARKVMKEDNTVDDLFNQIKLEVIQEIAQNPDEGELCVDMMMIAKYFERIADHVVNIAEWVEYSVTGEHKEHD